MSALFFEGRTMPAAVKQQFSMGRHYAAYGADAGDAASSIVNSLTTGAVGIAKAVSPWDMLTGLFVTKPLGEEQLQAQAQAAQLQAATEQRTTLIRTVAYAGVGLVGIIVLAVALKPPKPHVSGYRRRRRRR